MVAKRSLIVPIAALALCSTLSCGSHEVGPASNRTWPFINGLIPITGVDVEQSSNGFTATVSLDPKGSQPSSSQPLVMCAYDPNSRLTFARSSMAGGSTPARPTVPNPKPGQVALPALPTQNQKFTSPTSSFTYVFTVDTSSSSGIWGVDVQYQQTYIYFEVDPSTLAKPR